MGEVREKVLSSLQDAPDNLDTAEAFIQIYPKDQALIDATIGLYVAILTALEGIMIWFDHGSSMSTFLFGKLPNGRNAHRMS